MKNDSLLPALTSTERVKEYAGDSAGLSVYFYLGLAILFGWTTIIVVLVRHYWWSWLVGICCRTIRCCWKPPVGEWTVGAVVETLDNHDHYKATEETQERHTNAF